CTFLALVADAAGQSSETSIFRYENDNGIYENDFDGIVGGRRNRLQLHHEKQIRALLLNNEGEVEPSKLSDEVELLDPDQSSVDKTRSLSYGVKGPRKEKIDVVQEDDVAAMGDKKGKKKKGKSRNAPEHGKDGYVCLEYALPKSGKMVKGSCKSDKKGDNSKRYKSKGSKSGVDHNSIWERRHALFLDEEGEEKIEEQEPDEADENFLGRKGPRKNKIADREDVVALARNEEHGREKKKKNLFDEPDEETVCVKWCPSPTSTPTPLITSAPSVKIPCGNGMCDNGENCNTCPVDCGVCPSPTSTPTPPITSAPSVKIPCGNGICDNGENCNTCPVDCGVCPSPTSTPTPPLTSAPSVKIPCGNGICDNGENCFTCPFDCGVCPSPTSTPTSPITSAPSLQKCVKKAGSIQEYWFEIPGLTIDSLKTGTNNFQKKPDLVIVNTVRLEIPSNRKDPVTGKDVDNYGVRVKGYIVPPMDGAYTFWIASDDQGEFSLSTDECSGNLVKMCEVSLWVTSSTEYDKYPGQKSKAVDLVAGKLYYYEALMKEGPLEDYLSIAWQAPSKEREMLPGMFLVNCEDPDFNYSCPQVDIDI
ncbi:hypothetical protein ACHAXA_008690, partial [Cyclostephanos tholiformis]